MSQAGLWNTLDRTHLTLTGAGAGIQLSWGRLQHLSVYAKDRTEGRPVKHGYYLLVHMGSMAGRRPVWGTLGIPILIHSSFWEAWELGMGVGQAKQFCSTHYQLCGMGPRTRGIDQVLSPTGKHESQGRVWIMPDVDELKNLPMRTEATCGVFQARSNQPPACTRPRAGNGPGRGPVGTPVLGCSSH